jgi:thioredoxin 1
MSILSLDQSSFASTVTQSANPVLVDFWAEWCGPCHMLSPVVEALAEEHPEITFAKVNVDEAPELAQSFQVSAIPTLVLIKDGKVADVSVGVKSKEQLESFLK